MVTVLTRAPDSSRLAVRKRCIEDHYFFCAEVLGLKEAMGSIWTERIHRPICTFIGAKKSKKFRVLLAPRGIGKSTLLTVADSLRCNLIGGGELCQGIAHFKKETAVKFLSDIAAQCETNDYLKWIAPDVFWSNPRVESPTWKQDEILLKRRRPYRVPSYVAFSSEATAIGIHFDIIRTDDAVLKDNVTTTALKDNAKQFFRSLNPMLRKAGWMYVTVAGTRWDHDEAHGMLVDPDGDFATVVDKMVLSIEDENGESTWPEVYPTASLAQLRKEYGSLQYASNMLNSPIPGGKAVFKTTDVVRYELDPLKDYAPILPDDRNYYFYTAIDPNTKESTAYDPAVVTTCARDSEGGMWVVDVTRGHPSPFELIDWIRNHVKKWNPLKVMLEVVQAQSVYVPLLYRDSLESGVVYNIEQVTRGGRENKYSRIVALQPLIESGKLHVPRGTVFEDLMKELEVYHPKAERDDILDTLADIFARGATPPPLIEVKEQPRDTFLVRKILGITNDPTSRRGNRLGVRSRATGVRVR